MNPDREGSGHHAVVSRRVYPEHSLKSEDRKRSTEGGVHMKNTIKLVTLILLFTVLAVTPILGEGQSMSDQQPVPERYTIGVVYGSYESMYLTGGITYQNFARRFGDQMEELASKEGFELIVYESGFAPTGVCGAVQSMIAREVDAILLDLEAPVICTRAVLDAQNAGVPIAYYGARPPEPVSCPVIGYNNHEGARKLGAAMARLFGEKFGEMQPRILVTATRSVPEDRALERGFVDGFKTEVPDAVVSAAIEDLGTVEGTTNAVAASLLKHSDVNVMFGTSDIRARGALNALAQSSTMDTEKVLLSGVGGSEDAMRELHSSDTPWTGELAFPLQDAALQSYQVLLSMIQGELTITSETEYLIMPQVFVKPDAEKIRRYLRVHRGIELLQ